MSDIFAIYTHSYLQARSSSVNPRIINRCVNLARTEATVADISYFEPPWFRVTSEQPDIPSENADVTRRPLAFGSWALPKLRRELHDSDDFVVIQALLSLCDLIHDPERAYEALQLKIPDRLADKLLDPLPPVRESSVLLLSLFARLADGKEAIVKNKEILENLYLTLGDEQISIRLKSAACIELVSRSWMAADVLVETGLIETLLELIEKDEPSDILEYHLKSLKCLMYECGKCIALKHDGFKIFMKLLNHEKSSIVCKALDCLAILTSTKKGKKLAIEKNLLKTLTKLIHYGDTDMCKSAASVIMFCTVKTRAKILAAEIKSLAKRLIRLSTNPLNVALQMFSIKALTNICEHPLVRKEVYDRYLNELTQMQVDPTNAEYKKTLLQIVSWVPYKSE
ncbi:hypothetical protein Zmor_010845 [Zophobas morio]|uniref:Rhabdoid tumor deletion region protein 1 n=1 Tax=Zophobas morio TaxID=2755281 RepID=A0AA38IPB5_9CUCU|nr:hypothetical protein Zmor_010845 [Zophobas morio]